MGRTLNCTGLVCAFLLAFVYQQWRDICGYDSGGRVTANPNKTYDYIVVGAGSAGSVVAARLSEDPGTSVLLLEAGDEETASPFFHIPIGAFMPVSTSLYWDYKHAKQTMFGRGRNDGADDIAAMGRVLGGTSIVNYLLYTRGSKHDYNSWTRNGCDGWEFENVLPFFLKSEDFQSVKEFNSDFHSTGGFLGVTEHGNHPFTDAFLNAGVELGYPLGDHNERDIVFSNIFSTTRNGVRSSTSRDLLRPAMHRENLHVVTNSVVTRVIIDDKRALGVEFIRDNRKENAHVNKEIIVSAGTLGSSKLLMLSGIGPKSDLDRLDIPVVADLPVGHNLQNHVVLPIWSNVNGTDYSMLDHHYINVLRYIFLRTGPMAAVISDSVAFVRTDERKDGIPDMQINLITSKFDAITAIGRSNMGYINEGQGFTFLLIPSHPKSSGVVKLLSRDPFDQLLIDPKYLSNGEDMHGLVKGIRLVEKLMNTSAMRQLNVSVDINKIPMCDNEVFDSDEYWKCFISYAVFPGLHFAGTCKMGSLTDNTTVVDPQLRVKGVAGLRVADASVIPSLIAGNTNAPVIMIGERAAEFIKTN